MSANYACFYNSRNGDRVYDAESMTEWLRPFFTTGVFNGQLQVTANNDMSVTVAGGYCNIKGIVKNFVNAVKLDLETASGTLDRIDTVILRRNDTDRDIQLIIQTGGYSSKPKPAPLARTGAYYDLKLAEIYVAAGAVHITQAEITDTRMDGSVCGWVCATVKEIDFSQIYTQFTAYQKKKEGEVDEWQQSEAAALTAWVNQTKKEKTEQLQKTLTDFETVIDSAQERFDDWYEENTGNWGEEWTAWFNNLKEQLTENAVTNLQNQIGDLKNLTTTDKSNLVAALNEVKEIVVTDLQNQIGDLKNLTTTNKSNLVAALNEVKGIAGVTGVKGNKESSYRKNNVNITPANVGAVNREGDTMSGTLGSSKTTGTHLAGNQGQAIINSTAAAGAYTMLDKLNSTNGYFTDGVYNGKRLLQYTAKATADAKTNAVTKSLTMMDESGNSEFPGTVKAPTFQGNLSGNAATATKLVAARSINGMLFDGSADRVNYGVCDTAAGTEKILAVKCDGFKLVTGAEINVVFTNVHKYAYGYKLNVNNTGEINIKFNSSTGNQYGFFEKERIYKFFYDGTNWIWTDGISKVKSIGLDAYAADDDMYIPLPSWLRKYLVVGTGSSSSTSSYGTDDYFKVSLLVCKASGGNVTSWNNAWQELTLASSGSTARFSLAKENDYCGVHLKVPKGSQANLDIYEMN
ncbi:MAG: alpha-helical pore-forming toxin family protein [Lachnospiraceae bacterium]|nr:alpha-helical pore-forming toxin family protein [Lachnospiraceae bacterium]